MTGRDQTEPLPDQGEAATTEQRGERIAKWLARAGVASRRDAEKLIAEGKVRLNNTVVTHPATFVGPGDLVLVGGKLVERTAAHPPVALPQAGRPDDHASRPARPPHGVRQTPRTLPRVISIGRLDLNSEGLLLLTNDGALARQLELPSTGWLRRYRVRVHGQPEPAALAALAKGITIDGVRYGEIDAGLDSRKGENAWLTVSLREGRNREVRRVMAHLGLAVSRLIRIAYGPFQLGALPRGEVEEIPARVLRDQLPRDQRS